eukprot:CAMPEP_0170175208 /NCGR_PEP_ID=MMETSP0040_2-20121228/8335_1 /TAXON_ID=641309 /ORGANISM="Lotharella oceanica, Strain CCMP622" /LENGTH=68 /DNA_ID=CAMNT_0010417119 /DNA_START=55 /DNA_END=261 /DNA_ORIENTATION=+
MTPRRAATHVSVTSTGTRNARLVGIPPSSASGWCKRSAAAASTAALQQISDGACPPLEGEGARSTRRG